MLAGTKTDNLATSQGTKPPLPGHLGRGSQKFDRRQVNRATCRLSSGELAEPDRLLRQETGMI